MVTAATPYLRLPASIVQNGILEVSHIVVCKNGKYAVRALLQHPQDKPQAALTVRGGAMLTMLKIEFGQTRCLRKFLIHYDPKTLVQFQSDVSVYTIQY